MAKHHRFDIESLKAIAIISIVLYHLFDLLKYLHLTDSRLFDGGFLGVDVFFLVSGFFITTGIYSKLAANDFGILQFYQRRLLRILPPLLVLFIFCLGVGYFLLESDVYLELSKEIKHTLCLDGNFRFAKAGGYFSLGSFDKLALHTWYLCITLQFYILYPVILILIKKYAGLQNFKKVMLGLTAFLVLLSIVCGLKGQGYLLTQCRLFCLFIGGCLALYKDELSSYTCRFSQKKTNYLEIFAVAGLIVTIMCTRLNNGQWYIYHSLPAIFFTSIIIILNNQKTILKNRILGYTGKISYSIYLWHWPIMIFYIICGYSNTIVDNVILFALIASFSILSYYLTEKPKIKLAAIVLMLIAIIASCHYISNVEGKNYLSDYFVKEATRQVNDDVPLPPNKIPVLLTEKGGVELYRYGRNDLVPHTFIIGDSHADHYTYFFKNVSDLPVYMAVQHGNMAYGPIFANIDKDIFYTTPENRRGYFDIYKEVLSYLKSGDNVVIANRWDSYYWVNNFRYDLSDSDKNFDDYLLILISDLDFMISKRPDLNFYIVGQGVVTSDIVAKCLRLDLNESFLKHFISKNRCKDTNDYLGKRFFLINKTLSEYAQSRANVTFIDRNVPLSLPNGRYKTYSDDGVPLYYDDNHYSSEGGIIVGKYILDQIKNK